MDKTTKEWLDQNLPTIQSLNASQRSLIVHALLTDLTPDEIKEAVGELFHRRGLRWQFSDEPRMLADFISFCKLFQLTDKSPAAHRKIMGDIWLEWRKTFEPETPDLPDNLWL